MNGATVLTRFTADTKDLDDKTKKAQSSLSNVAKGISSAFKVATAAITAASVAVGAIVKQSVEAYAEYEQLVGGVETLFAESEAEIKEYEQVYGKTWDELKNGAEGFTTVADEVLSYANEAYKTAGISANEYMNQVNSFAASLKKSVGGNSREAMELANMAIQDMADNANKMGTSMEAIQNAYQGLAKGNATMLDNLKVGYGGTSTQMLQLAKDMGVVEDSVESFNDIGFDKAILAIHKLQEQLGITGTTELEAATTITGSLNMTKASWQNLLTEFSKGGDLTVPIDNFIQSAKTFADNIIPVIITALTSIGNVLPSIVDKINEVLPSLVAQVLPSLIQAVVTLVNGVISALPSLIKVLLPPLIEGVMSITTAIIEMLPDIIIMIAEMLPSLIPQIVDAILGIIPILIDNLPLFINAGFQLLGGLIAGILNALPNLLMRAVEITVKLLNAFKEINLWDIGKNLLKGLWNGLVSMKDWVIRKIKELGQSILNGLKSVLGIKSPSKEFAIIGRYSVLGYTEALEDMDRDVKDQIAETFALSPQLSPMNSMHFSPNIINNNYVDVKQDPLGQMVSSVKTFAGGAKNDFNYGAGV